MHIGNRDDPQASRGAGERHGRWSRVLGLPLTGAQERALLALVELCPEVGGEAPLRPIADVAGLPPGPATLALRGLVRRRMAWRQGDDGDEAGWTPTQIGRQLAGAFRLG
jgi:hypothetical protein